MLMRTTTSNPMLTRTNNLRSNPILKHLLNCINCSSIIFSPCSDADHGDYD